MTVSINVRMPEGLYREIENAAREGQFSSVPDFVRQSLREKLYNKTEVSK